MQKLIACLPDAVALYAEEAADAVVQEKDAAVFGGADCYQRLHAVEYALKVLLLADAFGDVADHLDIAAYRSVGGLEGFDLDAVRRVSMLAKRVSDFFRLVRHFGNWRVVGTEQDSENIYIDVRRVVSKNQYMLGQKWVLKPYLLNIENQILNDGVIIYERKNIVT